MSYIMRNEYGAFCSVCQSPLGLEEDDWDECDACGGEGNGGDDDQPWEGDLSPEEEAIIEAAWQKHKAAVVSPTVSMKKEG